MPEIVSVYVLVTVGVAVVFVVVVADRFAPLQVQLVVELLVFAVRFTVPPWQIGPLLVIPVEAGTGLTETTLVNTVAFTQPEPVPVTVSE